MITDTKNRTLLSIQATPDFSGMRTAELKDIEYTIVPCVALVEGVLWPANAPAPELALAEEFGRFPDGWNGRPVVMNHPQIEGEPVSACSPGIIAEFEVGTVFNTTVEDGKLKMDLWINTARAKELGGEIETTVERLLSGDTTVEVSTGLFTMSESVSGVHDGQEYSSIWRNIVPDHLALLSEGTLGACSVAGGCGAPRINKMQPAMRAMQLKTDIKTEPVIAKEDCGCHGECDDCQASLNEGRKGIFQSLRELTANAKDTWNLMFKGNVGMSDSDIRSALSRAIDAAVDDQVTWVIAIFQESNGVGSVVYEVGWDCAFFSRSYNIAEGGGVTLGEEVTAVTPRTEFIPLELAINASKETPNGQEIIMDKTERVAALIANKATKFTEDNQEWLMTLEESQLEALEPVIPEVVKDTATEDLDTGEQKQMSLEEHLKTLPPEAREAAEEGIAIQKAAKETLVKGLKANKACDFTEEELNSRSLKELKSIAKLANVPVPDYSGQGVVTQLSNNAATDDDFTAAPTTLRAKTEPATAAA